MRCRAALSGPGRLQRQGEPVRYHWCVSELFKKSVLILKLKCCAIYGLDLPRRGFCVRRSGDNSVMFAQMSWDT